MFLKIYTARFIIKHDSHFEIQNIYGTQIEKCKITEEHKVFMYVKLSTKTDLIRDFEPKDSIFSLLYLWNKNTKCYFLA